MRIAVLDESVPRQLATALREFGIRAHEFRTAWKGLPDRALLDLAEALSFHVLVTADRHMRHQQDVEGRRLGVVVLPTNRKMAILSRVEDIADTIARIEHGQHVEITASGQRLIGASARSAASRMPSVMPFEF